MIQSLARQQQCHPGINNLTGFSLSKLPDHQWYKIYPFTILKFLLNKLFHLSVHQPRHLLAATSSGSSLTQLIYHQLSRLNPLSILKLLLRRLFLLSAQQQRHQFKTISSGSRSNLPQLLCQSNPQVLLQNLEQKHPFTEFPMVLFTPIRLNF